MLINALENASDTVFVDLLTYQDLEMLKARKGSARLNSSGNTNTSTMNSKLARKRYMILTYAVEYDRVHYPLPLNYEEIPDAAAL
jgi:coiled-coil domain-containing protein 61